MKPTQRIGIVGGGSWATALSKILHNKTKQVNWWIRTPEAVNFIKTFRHNPGYLSYVEFNTEYLTLSNDLAEVVRNSDIIIWSIPAAFLHSTLEQFAPGSLDGKIIISAIKGIVPEQNMIISRYFEAKYGVTLDRFGVIAGPCHAEEVVMEKLSYLTVASENPQISSLMAKLLSSRFTKVSTTFDVIGVEFASVLKNIFAVAAGICSGLGYGDNFQSVLTTNSIIELRRFLDAINHHKRDVNLSVYSGDIIVTSYSQFSRNRAFGTLIGKGYSVNYSKIEMKQVAEGYYAVKCIKEINSQFKVDMPIIDAVFNILYNGIAPGIEMKVLADKLA